MTQTTRDYPGIALGYARAVLGDAVEQFPAWRRYGKRAAELPPEVACKWVRLACERFLRDLDRVDRDESFPYVWDERQVSIWCTAVEQEPHIKGEWARRGERICLEPWQVFIVANLQGWRERATGLRRFHRGGLSIARKNAKTTFGAALLKLSLAPRPLDGEEGAESYSAATTRDQAKISWGIARQMALRSPEFCLWAGMTVGTHALTVEGRAGTCKPLSSESDSLQGLSVHFALVDEFHVHPTREVWDVLDTATGSRLQPLILWISTAGVDQSGICYEQQRYLERVLEGQLQNDRLFGMVFTLDEGDDWRDRNVWRKANPNLGVSVYEADLEQAARQAEQDASKTSAFLRYRMNIWVNADVAWLPPGAWHRCGDPSLKLEDFAGEECIGALDLVTREDIASFVLVFRRKVESRWHYYLFVRHFLPEETVENSSNAQYVGWARDGWLEPTAGQTLDFEAVLDAVREAAADYRLIEVAYDEWQAAQAANTMEAGGLTCVKVPHQVKSFSEPMKTMAALVREQRFHHNGDPVLAWMVSNVRAKPDRKDNVYPRKERPENKIDDVVATLMALGRWLVRKEPPPSVYADPAWDAKEPAA